MSIEVAKLRRHGMQIDLGTDPALRELAAVVLEGEVSSLSGSLGMRAEGHILRVAGTVEATVARTCERCGEPLTLTIGGDFQLVYIPEDSSAEGGEHELSSDELELGWYREGAVEVEDLVSEALALQLPPLVACADSAACASRTQALLAQYGRSGEEGGLSGLRALMNKG